MHTAIFHQAFSSITMLDIKEDLSEKALSSIYAIFIDFSAHHCSFRNVTCTMLQKLCKTMASSLGSPSPWRYRTTNEVILYHASQCIYCTTYKWGYRFIKMSVSLGVFSVLKSLWDCMSLLSAFLRSIYSR